MKMGVHFPNIYPSLGGGSNDPPFEIIFLTVKCFQIISEIPGFLCMLKTPFSKP